MFDLEKMRQLAETLFVDQIAAHYGRDNVKALLRLLDTIHEVHHSLAYELLTNLTVFVRLSGDAPGPSTNYLDIPVEHLPQFVEDVGAVEKLSDGRYRIWTAEADVLSLAEDAIVYQFSDADYFVVGGELRPVLNTTGFPSVFGLPTFVDLEKALNHYSAHMARYSTCKILSDCWNAARRIILANEPEGSMRRSLAQFLKATLRDHEMVEVREEQIVDESHPVDIKVTWSLPHRLALIEVKWLGDCVNRAGDALSSTHYRDARAREGAAQLCQYLTDNRPHSPTHITLGYLVVYDARRRGIIGLESETQLSAEDATFYRNIDVSYEPEWHVERLDFARPHRFYLEPAV